MKAPTPEKKEKEKEKDKKDKEDEKDKDGAEKEKENEEKEKEKEKEKDKKMVTNDKRMLLSCSYFDLSHCGYFEAKVSFFFNFSSYCLFKQNLLPN